jgi:hypothetical protein
LNKVAMDCGSEMCLARGFVDVEKVCSVIHINWIGFPLSKYAVETIPLNRSHSPF